MSKNDTEFMAEVVIVDTVYPHPNADRLELVKFSSKAGPTLYTCVTQKGTFKRDDYAGYFSVDCIVPLDKLPFAFLATRPDGQGKSHFRLRAARLRGVYSEGLIIPMRDIGLGGMFNLGDDLAEPLGITYHQPPVKGEPSGPTPKSAKNAAKLANKIPEYSVISLRKEPDLFVGKHVIMTEKVHGTNFRFGWVDGQFVVGSHRVIKSDHRSFFRKLWDKVTGKKPPKGYYTDNVWCRVAERLGLAAKTRLAPNVMFYGEIYGPGIQDMGYGLAENGTQVRLFDAYWVDAKKWATRWALEAMAADLDLPPLTPVLYRGVFNEELMKKFAEDDSIVAGSKGHICEGVVVEALEGVDEGHKRNKGKYVSQRYRMREEKA